MRFSHLAQKLFCEPLLVLPSTYATFERALLQRMALPYNTDAAEDPHARPQAGWKDGDDHPRERVAETPAQRSQRRVGRVLSVYGSVAVISIDGAIDKRLSDSELSCYGGVDLNDIDAAISQVGSDPRIAKVVFDINSPGGSAAGVAETAERIRLLGAYKSQGGAAKETHARVELLCASAAQWLASPCDNISVAPGATMGSVGVYCAMLDQTGWLEQNGLKVNLVKAGKYKAMGAAFNPLSDDERTMLQSRVNDLWAEFKSAVSATRDVAEETMQGQTFTGDQAKKLKLADEVKSASLDEYVSSLM